jgi:membrane protein implicated in regulation of membrane protease activity
MMLWQEWWIWAVAGILLGIVEVIVPGYIFLGFAVGAMLVALTLLICGVLGLGAGAIAPLLLLFAVGSLVGWYLLRRIFGIHQGSVKTWERDINDNG